MRKLSVVKLLRLVAPCLLLWLVLGPTASHALAVDRTWNNPAGGDFSDPTNWTPNGVPGAADNALITLSGTYGVYLSANKTVSSLTLGAASGTQTLDTNFQSLTLGNASTINVRGVLNNSDTLTANGALTVSGTLFNSGATNAKGALTINGTMTHSGGIVAIPATGSLTIASGGTYNLNFGSLNGAGPQTIASGGVFNWQGGAIEGSAITQTTTIGSGGRINFSGFGGQTLDGRTLTNNGLFNWTDGSSLLAINGAIFNNESGALVDVSTPNNSGSPQFTWNNIGTNPTFNNKAGATLRKRNGTTNELNFIEVKFNNSGTVDTQAGATFLGRSGANDGLVTLNGGSTLTGAGATYIADAGSANGTTTLGTDAKLIISRATMLTGTNTTFALGTNSTLTLDDANFGDSGLSGPLAISGTGTFNWNGGTIGGSGTTTLAATVVTNLGGNSHVLDGHTLTNNGAFNWLGNSSLLAINGAIFNNESGALVDVSTPNNFGDASFYWDGTGSNPIFNNKAGATLRKRNGNTNSLTFRGVKFNDSGIVDTQAGTTYLGQNFGNNSGGLVTLNGGSTFTGAGLTRIDDTGSANGTTTLGTDAKLTIGGAMTLTGTNAVFALGTNGTLTLNDASFGDLGLFGPLAISGTGTFNWLGGIIGGSGVTTLASTVTTNLTNLNGLAPILDGHTLTNNGIFNLTDGTSLLATNGAIFNNESGALVDVSASNNSGSPLFYWDGNGDNPTFNNKAGATLRKRVGTTNEFRFRDTKFNNSGTVDTQTGTVFLGQSFSGGGLNTLTGGTFTGAGLTVLSDDSVTSGTITIQSGARLELQSGILSGTATLAGAGMFNWTSGTIGGAGVTTLAATLITNLTGSNHILDGHTLTNNGVFNWPDASSILAINGAIFNNESGGLVDISTPNNSGSPQFYWDGNGENPTFNNKVGATLRKRNGSTNELSFYDVKFNNSGTIDTQAGTTYLGRISSGGGLVTLNGGSSLTGAGVTRIADTGSANGTTTLGTDAKLNIGGAMTLTGTNAVFALGTNGTLFLENNLADAGLFGPLAISGTGIFNWNGGIIGGSGTTTLAATVTTNLTNLTGNPTLDAHTLSNNGTFNFQGDLIGTNGAIFNNESGALVDANFANANHYFYWDGNNTNPFFINKAGATVRKRSSNSSLIFEDVKVTNNGIVEAQAGTLELVVNYYGGGTLTNLSSTTLTGGTYIVTGTLTVPSDIMTNAANITLNTSTSAIVNTATGSSALDIFKTNAATGVLTLTGNKTLIIPGGTNGFTNAGTVNLANTSVLDVQGTNNNYVQTGGATVLQGGTLKTTTTGSANINGGTLSGAGTVNAKLNNAANVTPGTPAPGTPAAKINTGNYNQTSAGTFTAQIGGTNAATPDFDQLNVTGTVTLNGALTASLINNFVPSGGNSFVLINNDGTDAVTGTFTGLPQGAIIGLGGRSFQIDYAGGTGNDVTLKVVPLVSIDDVSVTEGNSGTINAVFTVTLSIASSDTVTVNAITADGSAIAPADYTALASTKLTFAPGETTKTVTVVVKGDTLNEGDETFFVNLSGVTNAAIADAQGKGTIVDDDPQPELSVNDVSIAEGNSGLKNLVFTVSLNNASSKAITVNYATSNGTAIAGSDYVAKNGSLTFAPGVTAQTVTIEINGDTLNELDETFNLALTAPVNATLVRANGVGTITNDDPLPSLAISDVSVVEGNSGTTNATLTVTLSAASGRNVTVDFATADGTATAGSDYTAQNGTLTFTPGQTSRNITIAVTGDTVTEANETILVNLTNVTNATLADAQGVVTITDDEVMPALSINDVSVKENNTGTTNAVFIVTLNTPSPASVTVNYTTVDATAIAPGDYITTSGTLTFAAGETTKTISVPVKGDTLNETNEFFRVNLSDAANATIADRQGIGTILDDDRAPAFSINDVTVTEGNSGTVNATFTITLSTPSGQTATINVIPSNGSARSPFDYVSGGARLIFAPGEVSKTFTVPVKGDLLDEPDETFFVILSSAVNASVGRGRGLGTITDDDAAPSISIDDVRIGEGNIGQRTAAFRLKLSAPSGQIVRVNYATGGGTATAGNDYDVVPPTQISFTTGNIYAYARVLINGDVLNEPDETFFVNLTNPVAATIVDSQALGTILNDDSAPALTISDASMTEGNSGTKTLNFTVTLSKASGQNVSVNYATSDGTAKSTSDYAAKTGSLNFAPGSPLTQTISVTVNGDTVVEGDETLFVFLSTSVNASIGRARGVGTITNDDTSG